MILTIRIVVADDHPTLLAGMQYLISHMPGLELVGTGSDSTDLVDLLGRQACDVAIVDYAMPGGDYGDGISLFAFLQRRFPALNLVVLTGLDSASVLRIIVAAGVNVIVSKLDDPEYLHEAIFAAQARQAYLSPAIRSVIDQVPMFPSNELLSKRETEVVRLFAEGLSVSEIGIQTGRSRKTISVQKLTARRKLGLASDAELVRYALENGLLQGSQAAR
jgi:DNA-binding NarL/FixJ family response regulator